MCSWWWWCWSRYRRTARLFQDQLGISKWKMASDLILDLYVEMIILRDGLTKNTVVLLFILLFTSSLGRTEERFGKKSSLSDSVGLRSSCRWGFFLFHLPEYLWIADWASCVGGVYGYWKTPLNSVIPRWYKKGYTFKSIHKNILVLLAWTKWHTDCVSARMRRIVSWPGLRRRAQSHSPYGTPDSGKVRSCCMLYAVRCMLYIVCCKHIAN